MDFQSAKTHYGAHWAWLRTGALILFLVAGVLLAASLAAFHYPQSAYAKVGTSISALIAAASAG